MKSKTLCKASRAVSLSIRFSITVVQKRRLADVHNHCSQLSSLSGNGTLAKQSFASTSAAAMSRVSATAGSHFAHRCLVSKFLYSRKLLIPAQELVLLDHLFKLHLSVDALKGLEDHWANEWRDFLRADNSADHNCGLDSFRSPTQRCRTSAPPSLEEAVPTLAWQRRRKASRASAPLLPRELVLLLSASRSESSRPSWARCATNARETALTWSSWRRLCSPLRRKQPSWAAAVLFLRKAALFLTARI